MPYDTLCEWWDVSERVRAGRNLDAACAWNPLNPMIQRWQNTYERAFPYDTSEGFAALDALCEIRDNAGESVKENG